MTLKAFDNGYSQTQLLFGFSSRLVEGDGEFKNYERDMESLAGVYLVPFCFSLFPNRDPSIFFLLFFPLPSHPW